MYSNPTAFGVTTSTTSYGSPSPSCLGRRNAVRIVGGAYSYFTPILPLLYPYVSPVLPLFYLYFAPTLPLLYPPLYPYVTSILTLFYPYFTPTLLLRYPMGATHTLPLELKIKLSNLKIFSVVLRNIC